MYCKQTLLFVRPKYSTKRNMEREKKITRKRNFPLLRISQATSRLVYTDFFKLISLIYITPPLRVFARITRV